MESKRKVSLLLAVGIILMPIIFSWVTLRQGYSTLARVVSVIWMVLIFMGISASPSTDGADVESKPETIDKIENTEQSESVKPEIPEKEEVLPDISYNEAGEKLYMGETEEEIIAKGKWDELTPDEEVTEPIEKPKPEPAECDTDMCFIDRHSVDLRLYCRPEIEALATYDFEWTDGLFTQWYSRGGVSEDNADHLMIFGDKLKFQNGFGAWANVIYMCVYDMKNKEVVRVAAEAGRL